VAEIFESILIVFVNPLKGRDLSLDDWYTNIHIRDVMRIEGGISAQRFIASDNQLKLEGKTVVSDHKAHTIFEWESAEKSVVGHIERAGTPAMLHTRDCFFGDELGGYFRPVHLSDGWSRENGFKRGLDLLTVLMTASKYDKGEFESWFRNKHAPATLAMPGFASAALFEVHEATKRQSLPKDFPYSFAAFYGMSNRHSALIAWSARHDQRDPFDLSTQADGVRATCWEPRTARILRESVVHPSAEAVAEERRAHLVQQGRFYSRADLEKLLIEGKTPQISE
jgi:hypothetical protein